MNVTGPIASRWRRRIGTSEDPRRAAGGSMVLLFLALMAAGSLASCRSAGNGGSSGNPALDLRDPSFGVRADGAFAAGIEGRRDLLPALVRALEDPSPAVRAWAADSLFELTGERHGYHPYLPPEERAASVARWREWLLRGAGGGRGADPNGRRETAALDAPSD
ncbi:MAG: HEAT repeat domain-containing protein [Planctomycetes bacterium]|nr:HEAT repeat domain-containing protein [Planctomycetota bacterium]